MSPEGETSVTPGFGAATILGDRVNDVHLQQKTAGSRKKGAT